MKDLTNKVFGRLIVIKRLPATKINNRVRSKWLCQCSCGNIVEILMDCLTNNHTTSCGCLRKETAAATKHDLSGQTFGLLTVLEETPKRRLRNIIWKCQCSCDSIIEVAGSSLIKGHTKSCGCLQKQKASKSFHIFNKAYRLSKGYEEDELITSETKLIRQAITISGIKHKVKQRDSYKCVLCASNIDLKVHHIEPFAISREKHFDINNLITLCESCHKLVHNYNYKQPPNQVLTEQLKGIVNKY